MKLLKIYNINNEYIDYLRKFDSRVPFNKNGKWPFVGVVYECNGCLYFAPLSIPKPKHKKMSNGRPDVLKIKNGDLGVVNINNMIPVPNKCLTETIPTIEIRNEEDRKYKKLLEEQITYLNNHKTLLYDKVSKFYTQYSKGHLGNRLSAITCDLKLLEIKSKEFDK